ncbi:MAG: AI-2E family transporter [Planctomycetia bacterium]|nr:AI-2E family transporter [Planctomycetia bacterium]
MAAAAATANWVRPFIVLASLAIVLGLLYWAQAVLIPVALAALLTFLLAPVVTTLQRRGLGRVPAVVVVVVVTAGLVVGIGWLVAYQIASLVDTFPQYEQNISHKIASLRSAGQHGFVDKLETIVQRVTQDFQAEPGTGEKLALPVRVVEQDGPFNVTQLWSVFAPILEPFASFGLAVVLLIFMLIKREDLRDRLISLVGHGRLTFTTKALDEAGQRISRFLLLQLIINGTFGLSVGVGLFCIGVPYAFLWGFLAGTLRYIPYLGPWAAALLPLALSLLVFDSWFEPFLVVALFLVLELSSNMIMEPWLYGRGVGVSEAAQLVMIAFWTWLWGPFGLVLAVPLTVCLVVLGKYVPALKFFDTLLGDQPALEAQLGYYQRLLARDQDEAADIAEDHLQAHTLSVTFDELLVPALTYAKRDAANDHLSEDDQRYVAAATQDVAEELATFHRQRVGQVLEADADLPPVTILGCPARDETDEAALSLLRELLPANRCRLIPTTADLLTSEVLAVVEEKQPALLCIAALPPGGLAHTRLLCMRLRAKFPKLKIVVGRWGMKNNERQNERLLASGAAGVGNSLAETRNQILSLLPQLPARPVAAAIEEPEGEPAGVP